LPYSSYLFLPWGELSKPWIFKPLSEFTSRFSPSFIMPLLPYGGVGDWGIKDPASDEISPIF
jgi:hypothetical protein